MKKFAVLALALSAMFTLTACGEGNAPANNTAVNQTVNQAAVNGSVDAATNDVVDTTEPVNNPEVQVGDATGETPLAEGEVVDGISGTETEAPVEGEAVPAE